MEIQDPFKTYGILNFYISICLIPKYHIFKSVQDAWNFMES